MSNARALCMSIAALASPLAAQLPEFGDYMPIETSYAWIYTNSTNPFDTYPWTVLGMTTFVGQPAWELAVYGTSSWFVDNDGTTFTIYGYTDNGTIYDIPDVAIGPFADGHTFSTDTTCLTVIRDWSQLDHNLTGGYGVDPTLCDVVVWVWYDLNPAYGPGAQNPALESGGGVQYPYAITDIDWFQKGVGPIATQGVHADLNGSLDGSRYDGVASFVIGDNYCLSASNSSGREAHITATGSRVASDQDVTLQASCCPDNAPGLFYFGPNQLAGAPFGDGFRCVGVPNSKRMYPFAVSGPANGNPPGCAVLTADFTAPYATSISSGASLNFQFWYRDGMAMMTGFNLTDGLNVVFQ